MAVFTAQLQRKTEANDRPFLSPGVFKYNMRQRINAEIILERSTKGMLGGGRV